MIEISLNYSCGYITSVNALGHSNRRPENEEDAVCAAVSVLMINTYNSLEKLANAKLSKKTNKNLGLFNFKINSTPNDKTQLLMKSLELALKDISDNKHVVLYINHE